MEGGREHAYRLFLFMALLILTEARVGHRPALSADCSLSSPKRQRGHMVPARAWGYGKC